MGAERHPFPPFAWRMLRRPLLDDARAELGAALRALLQFQLSLGRWPPVRRAPDATPFVSLYAEGVIRGCFGSGEGSPPERLSRAFLYAAHDVRFGGLSTAQRHTLVAQVSYPWRARLLNPDTAADEIEVGTHGVALVHERVPNTLLLPHVARDQHLGPRELLDALLRKAGVGADVWRDGVALYAFETQDVIVGADRDRKARHSTREDAAAAWLASLVGADGSVTFAIDPRTRRRITVGEMHHGRAAVVVQALAAHGGRPQLVARARRKLELDIRSALGGAQVDAWPSNPEAIAATMALAVLAGVPIVAELDAFVRAQHVPQTPWHAAQVVAALGPLASEDLWATCVQDLGRHPIAPWTLIAADRRKDAGVRSRVARAVADALRRDGPHRGGASITPIPETALTALAVEALARHPSPWARAAVARGRSFVQRMQLIDTRVYGALDPMIARGAFSASPVSDLLRCDITAHALLAILNRRATN